MTSDGRLPGHSGREYQSLVKVVKLKALPN